MSKWARSCNLYGKKAELTDLHGCEVVLLSSPHKYKRTQILLVGIERNVCHTYALCTEYALHQVHVLVSATTSSSGRSHGELCSLYQHLPQCSHVCMEVINVIKDVVLVVPTLSLWYYFSAVSSKDSAFLAYSKSKFLKLPLYALPPRPRNQWKVLLDSSLSILSRHLRTQEIILHWVEDIFLDPLDMLRLPWAMTLLWPYSEGP